MIRSGSRLLQLGQQASMLDQYAVECNTIKATLGQTESVMTSINSVLQRAKELAIGAGNTGYTDAGPSGQLLRAGQIEDAAAEPDEHQG